MFLKAKGANQMSRSEKNLKNITTAVICQTIGIIIILLFTYKTDKFQYFYNKIFTKSKNKIFS